MESENDCGMSPKMVATLADNLGAGQPELTVERAGLALGIALGTALGICFGVTFIAGRLSMHPIRLH